MKCSKCGKQMKFKKEKGYWLCECGHAYVKISFNEVSNE